MTSFVLTICHIPICDTFPTLLLRLCTNQLAEERLLRQPAFTSCSNHTFTLIYDFSNATNHGTTLTPKKKRVKLADLPVKITKKRKHPDTASGDEGTYFTFFTCTYNLCTLNNDVFHFPQTHETDDCIAISTLKKNISLIVLAMYLLIIECHV